MPVLASLALFTASAAAKTMGEDAAVEQAATYTAAGTAIAFIISELPRERAEALLQWQRWCPRRASVFSIIKSNETGLQLRVRAGRNS
jgi:hypothetical protein